MESWAGPGNEASKKYGLAHSTILVCIHDNESCVGPVKYRGISKKIHLGELNQLPPSTLEYIHPE